MKKVEINFEKSCDMLSYGDIVEVVSEEFENTTKQFLIVQVDFGVAILIDLDEQHSEWNRYGKPVNISNWYDLNLDNFAETFDFNKNAKVRKLTSKTTLVYEYSNEISVGDIIRWKGTNVSGVVLYKTKSEPVQYFIDEYLEGRVGLRESEVEKIQI